MPFSLQDVCRFSMTAALWAKLLLSTINKMNCFVSVWSAMTAVIFGLAAYSGAWHQYLLLGGKLLHSSGTGQEKQNFNNEFPLNEPRSACYLMWCLQPVSPQKKDHKEEILCAAHCPPSLLATGSYDGTVIVWDVVSGRVQCRLVSPSSNEQQHTDGDVRPWTLIVFLYSVIRMLYFSTEQDSMQVLRASYS